MKCKVLLLIGFFLCSFTVTKALADQEPSSDKYVSRAEYEKLKTDFETLKAQMNRLLQSQQSQPQATAPQTAVSQTEQGLEQKIKSLKTEVEEFRPGNRHFLVSGYAFTSYTDTHNANSVFTAGFNPVFLFQPTEKLLIETELEESLESGATKTSLEVANASYLLNDYVTLEAGKFLSPFGIFTERLHPKWINKLPNKPLGYPDGAAQLAPEAQIGAQVRGGVPFLSDTKFNYAFYVSNGPTVQTDAVHAGELSFTNTDENNHNKAIGGRVGFLPIPAVEVGYSFETSRVDTRDAGDVTLRHNDNIGALLQGVDFTFKRELDPLQGILDVRAEQIWSSVDSFDYGTGTRAFKNDRRAHYLQVAYRPSKIKWWLIRNFEFVLRYDKVNHPSLAPTHNDDDRYTWGLDYWLGPETVLKTAYLKDDAHGGVNQDSIIVEFVTGF